LHGRDFSGCDQPGIVKLFGKPDQTIGHRKGVEVRQNVQYPLILRHQGVPELVNEGLTQP
jgi:hypothetical protein